MKKILLLIMIGCLAQLFTACNSWLDVNPKSQIKSDILFQDEAGFKTALFGIYTSIAQDNLYGEALSMSFMDVLAQYYPVTLSTHSYANAVKYDYKASDMETKIKLIWKGMYQVIMNCNNLLENMDTHPDVFTGHNRDLIRGEVLGLRAYLHFDLLRMFAPSFAVGKDQPAIPFVDKVVRKPFPQLTNEQVIGKILADCKEALECLKVSDPLGPAGEGLLENNEILTDRKERMNYYAVKALLARVYLWSGDKVEAGKISEEMIATKGFGDSGPIFWLYSDKVKEHANDIFSTESESNKRLVLSKTYYDEYYESVKYGSFDRRASNWLKEDKSSTEGGQLVNKYADSKDVVLIRMSEMFYIHAECTDDEDEAIVNLNTVRRDFGIPEIYNLKKGECIFDDELAKECRKSFLAEGQMFYYMKRKDFSSIPHAVMVDDPRKVYCLPIPEGELEFGNLIK